MIEARIIIPDSSSFVIADKRYSLLLLLLPIKQLCRYQIKRGMTDCVIK